VHGHRLAEPRARRDGRPPAPRGAGMPACSVCSPSAGTAVTPAARATRSLISRTRGAWPSVRSAAAIAPSSRDHGRLVSCARPSTTGPAHGEHGARDGGCGGRRARDEVGEQRLDVGVVAARRRASSTGAMGPCSALTSASRACVPPMSPTRSMTGGPGEGWLTPGRAPARSAARPGSVHARCAPRGDSG
jgi:hypothetical protein